MFRMVKLFFIEELRLRSSFSTSLSLLIFPEFILIGALSGYIFLPILEGSITYPQVHLSVLSGLFFFGISMGGIAFLGKEFLERSLGPVNMLAASSTYQPVGQRRMYFAYFLHDALFYIMLVLAPTTAGLALGTIIRPIPLDRFILISASQWASFLLGLSLSLSVSSAVGAGRRRALAYAPLSVIPLLLLPLSTGRLEAFLPQYMAVLDGSWIWLLITFGLSAFYISMGILLFSGVDESYDRKKPGDYGFLFRLMSGTFKDPVYSALAARELINLLRGKAYVRISFSLFFPLIVMGGLVGFLQVFGSNAIDFNMPFFAVMISFFTMSVYTHLTNMDYLDYDQTIPVRTSDLVRVKVWVYLMISLPLAVVILMVIALIRGDLRGLFFSLPLVIVMVPYMGFVTAYLTGLWTNSMLFDASVFLRYMALTVGPLMFATLLSFLMDRILWISIFGLALIMLSGAVSTWIMARSLDEKWKETVLSSAGGMRGD
ncbi:MAG: hypothetical protein ACMUIE_07780 [Thermoplasmatota archaeon]